MTVRLLFMYYSVIAVNSVKKKIKAYFKQLIKFAISLQASRRQRKGQGEKQKEEGALLEKVW